MNTVLTNRKKYTSHALLIAIVILITACGSSRQSSQKLTQAGDMFEQIEQAGAMDYANAEYKEAQVKLEKARQLAEKGKHKKAMLRAEEAMAAAELAEARTLSAKADESLSALKNQIQSLKQQLEDYQ